MATITIKCTVSSDEQAARIREIIRDAYQVAAVALVSLGYIGGFFHEAPAIYTATVTNEASARAGWSRFVDFMHRAGYRENIY